MCGGGRARNEARGVSARPMRGGAVHETRMARESGGRAHARNGGGKFKVGSCSEPASPRDGAAQVSERGQMRSGPQHGTRGRLYAWDHPRNEGNAREGVYKPRPPMRGGRESGRAWNDGRGAESPTKRWGCGCAGGALARNVEEQTCGGAALRLGRKVHGGTVDRSDGESE